LSGIRAAALLAGLLALVTVFGVPLAAQENSDAVVPADSQMAGTVRTADGTGVPGTTLRVLQTSTGKAWITWTDDDGSFEFPALPSGHYRMEISQLGFAPATKEIDLNSGVKTPVDLKLEVSTLAAITAPAIAESAAKTSSLPPTNESTKSAPLGAPAADGASAASNPTTTAAKNEAAETSNGKSGSGMGGQRGGGAGGRNGQQGGGPGGPGQGGGRRAFQQVGLNGQATNPAESVPEDQPIAEAGGQLGQATSADAVQMIGTVAMGQTPVGGFPQPGDGGPETQMAFGNGGNGIPGQGGAVGPGGPGGPGGFGGGGFGGGGRGGGGGGGGRGRGPQGGPQGVAALWGAQRVMRQRVNRVHFSIYNIFGDSALNARPYSLYQGNPPKISSWTEQTGFNLGGPLKIPHVYDGTDKTFFYINFGGTWSRNPVDQFATVPTPSELAGDFSGLLGAPLYTTSSGVTTTVASGNTPLFVTQTNGISTQAKQGMIFDPSNHEAYAGNILTGPFSPTALALLKFFPAETPSLDGQAQNYHLQTNLPGLSNRLIVTLTHQLSSKLSLQVNYNITIGTSHSLSSFPGIEGNTFARGQSVTIGLTQNYTKTFMHTSQLYFSRSRTLGLNEFSNITNVSSDLCNSQCGILGISTAPYDYGLPQINFTNFTGLSDPNFYLSRSQTYRYVDSVRWLKAKHTVTVGGEIRKMEINRDTDPAPNGQFAFTGAFTSLLTPSGLPDEASQTGNDFADFLLGSPANARVQYGDTATYFRNWGFVGYATDDWHMFPKFTLTYGVRYEAFTPPTEINGHIANLSVNSDFTNVQCITPAAITTKTENCLAGSTPSLFNGHYNNWAPRLGIAWQPPGKWFSGPHQLTFRAGFSMFYVEAYLNTLAGEMANQPPFATANTLTNQVGAFPLPLTFQTNLATAVAGTLTNTVAVNPNYQVPYAMVWNTSIEYNLARSTFLELMYTGTRGVHLDELLGFGPSAANPNVAGFTYDTSGGFSNFNALQVRLQKRMTHGLMFMARYTFSKSLDDASTIGGGGQTVIQNNADPRDDYGLSSFNKTHQFLGTFTYDFPFGDRQRFARKGWKKAVFGELRLNGSATASSGTPFTVRVFSKNQACQNVPGTNSERADQSGDPSLQNPTTVEWFNTAAFGIPTACFGDAPRNSVIGPGLFDLNTGFAKSIFFGRDGLRRLDFVWDTMNALNHPNFTGLSTVLGSRTFGQITSVGGMRTMTFTTRMNF
jgi:hypothetical protein